MSEFKLFMVMIHSSVPMYGTSHIMKQMEMLYLPLCYSTQRGLLK